MGNSVSTLLCRNNKQAKEINQDTETMNGYDLESRGLLLDINSPHATKKCDCAEPGHNHGQHSNAVDTILAHMGTDIDAPFKPIFFSMPVGILECNMSIIGDPVTKEAVLVDPGGHPDKICEKIAELGVTIKQILITHGHFDHFMSAGDMRERTGAPIYLHPLDMTLWSFLPMQLKMMGFSIPAELVENLGGPDHDLQDGMKLGVLDGVVIHTPGHSQGSCCFYFEQSRLLIAGDTLFRNSVGRTDMLGGNEQSLRSSLINKLYQLPDSVTVICGHGPNTVLGHEKRNNPFLRAAL